MTKPCVGCKGAKPIYHAEEEYWKFDAETELYRIVNLYGTFYPLRTHPGVTEQQLVEYYGNKLVLATEVQIVWRSISLLMDAMYANDLL